MQTYFLWIQCYSSCSNFFSTFQCNDFWRKLSNMTSKNIDQTLFKQTKLEIFLYLQSVSKITKYRGLRWKCKDIKSLIDIYFDDKNHFHCISDGFHFYSLTGVCLSSALSEKVVKTFFPITLNNSILTNTAYHERLHMHFVQKKNLNVLKHFKTTLTFIFWKKYIDMQIKSP